MKIGPLAWVAVAALIYVTVKGRAPAYIALVSSQSNASAGGATTNADPTTAASKTGLPGATNNAFYQSFNEAMRNFGNSAQWGTLH
jgi:hypothetical protein